MTADPCDRCGINPSDDWPSIFGESLCWSCFEAEWDAITANDERAIVAYRRAPQYVYVQTHPGIASPGHDVARRALIDGTCDYLHAGTRTDDPGASGGHSAFARCLNMAAGNPDGML